MRRIATMAAAMVLMCAGAARADEALCRDPAGGCGKALSGECLDKLGAGAIAADAGGGSCEDAFAAYRGCLSKVAQECDRGVALAFPEPSAFGGQDPRFLLTAQGLGAVTRDKIVSLRDLRAYYPELALSIETFNAEGDVYSRISAALKDKPFFEMELVGGKFRDIVVFSPKVTDQNGASVGLALADLPVNAPAACFGMAEGSTFVACPAASDERIQYLFKTEGPGALTTGSPVAAIRLW